MGMELDKLMTVALLSRNNFIMKKLSKTQFISTRSIHLVPSERGAIINDLPARMRSKNIWTKLSAGNTYICFWRLFQKGKSKSVTKLTHGKKLGFQTAGTHRSPPHPGILMVDKSENQPWYVSALHGAWHTHSLLQIQWTNTGTSTHKPHSDAQDIS